MGDFAAFKKMVEAQGLEAKDCGKGHWRILGGKQEVNWYPESKKRSIYINGTSGRISFSGNEALAIEAAIGNLGKEKTPRHNPGFSKVKFKKQLLRQDPHCFKCRCLLVLATATLDHKIPLAKGGTNAKSNLQLACQKCNLQKGDQIL